MLPLISFSAIAFWAYIVLFVAFILYKIAKSVKTHDKAVDEEQAQREAYIKTTARLINQKDNPLTSSDMNTTEQSRENLSEKETQQNGERNYHTRDILLRTLRDMNCHLEFPDDAEFITVTYQSEHYAVYASNSSTFIRIVDPYWFSHELDDVDGVSTVRRAINKINAYAPTPLYYDIDNEHGVINVCSQAYIVFHESMPHLQNYLECYFHWFFQTQREFYQTLSENGMSDD